MKLLLELETICQELEAVNSQAVSLCEDLAANELAWRSKPGNWSIAENLVHLRMTTDTFLPPVDRAIAETKRRGLVANGPFRLRRYGRILVWYVEPPPKIRLPAPKVLRPLPAGSPTDALPEFLEAQMLMMQRMQAARGLDLAALRFASPLASYIRMNLLEFFSVFNGHSRRHMWQAANVRRQILHPPAATSSTVAGSSI
jgi:hypothetical protein